jgi:hypothetical protein
LQVNSPRSMGQAASDIKELLVPGAHADERKAGEH